MVHDSQSADLVLRNGRIYTVDLKRNWASAVAVKGGRIVAVGTEKTVAPLIGKATRVVDLQVRMAMPGIVDVHNRIMMGGHADLYETRFALDPQHHRHRGSNPCGGRQGSAGRLDCRRSMGHRSACAHQHLGEPRPSPMPPAAIIRVLLRDDTYHNRWVNSAALRCAGITADTPNPEKGEIGRDPETGALTGVMIEAASGLVERALADPGTTPRRWIAPRSAARSVC